MAENKDPFSRSGRTVRSPKTESKTTMQSMSLEPLSESIVLDPTKQNCQLCEELDSLTMVECEKCKGWFHWKCVNITDLAECKSWFCGKCRKEISSQKFSSWEEKTEISDDLSKKSTHSGKSQLSSASAARKKRLTLQRIEEERKLNETFQKQYLAEQIVRENELFEEKKRLLEAQSNRAFEMEIAREKIYLDKKYKTLEEIIESDSEPESVEDEVNGRKYTSDWVDRVNTSTFRNKIESDHDQDKVKEVSTVKNLDQRQQTHSIVRVQSTIPTLNVDSSFVQRQPISTPIVTSSFSSCQPNLNPATTNHQINLNSGFGNQQMFPTSFVSSGVMHQQPVISSSFMNYQPIISSGFTKQTTPIVSSGYTNNIPYSNYEFHNQHNVPIVSSTNMERQTNSISNNQGLPFTSNLGNQNTYSSFVHHQLPHTFSQSDYDGWPSAQLNTSQIAARHAMPKGLPKFTGRPEDWAIFRGAFVNSTRACGFSNVENLGRLTECLKGDARESVNFMLVRPEAVPQAMQTLEMMYGRTVLIIETLMENIQRQASPKDNDLNSLIKFAIAVKNLCETIRSSGSLDHLQNPLLLRMLVDKLPTQLKINWAYVQHASPIVNIAVLGDWLYGLAQVTSQVVGRPKLETPKNDNKDNRKPNHINAQIGSKSNNKQSESNEGVNSDCQSIMNVKSCPICYNESCKQIQDCKSFLSLNKKARWEVIIKHKLCGCCFGKHRYFKCPSRKKCTVEGCTSTHHILLHDDEKHLTMAKSQSSTSKVTKGNINSQRNSLRQSQAIFRIVPIILYSKKRALRTFAYLDDGSDLCLIERGLANELELSGIPDILSIQWAFGKTERKSDTEIVSVRISGDLDHVTKYEISELFTVEKLSLPTQSITRKWLEKYPHLKNLPISTYEDAAPQILIGLHSSKLIVSLETVEGRWNEPIACKTRLGWVVQGPDELNDNSKSQNRFSMNVCVCHQDEKLHQMVKEFFSFESFDVRISDKSLESKEIERSRQIMETTTVKKNGRYETGLLWRQDDVCLPDSYSMALKRLNCLESKMKKDTAFASKICAQIQDFVQKKYIRKLLPTEIELKNPRTWYLPIFVAFNPKKPLKVRTVWDAAAKVKGVSLNSVLLKGPDQVSLLPDVLRRFRERKIAVTGDLKEMFHQVRVREEDQCAQRFLWRDGESNRKPDVYVMRVMTFGATCSPSSAQFVKNENAKNYKDQFPTAVKTIIDNHYIDDMLECSHTVEEAIRLTKEVTFIHHQASFEMRNFISNSIDVLKALGENVGSQKSTIKNLNLSMELTTERVLGMFWNTSMDTFTYSLKYHKVDEEVMCGNRHPTKREVLRALMSIFDPLGLIANVLIFAKILLQKIWRKSTNWDEQIPESLHKDWATWIQLLPQVEQIQIPRLYSPKMSPKNPKSIQLHTFVDASLEACAAVTYLRVEDEFGVDCCLVGAKTKVAPNKPLTVPRLELQAAVLGTRLSGSILRSQRFKIEKRCFWSDSQIVLSWILSETRKFNQFVSFRVGEILENSDENEWNWVNTTDNVADEATKWKNKPNLRISSRWFKGPEFLYRPAMEWSMGINSIQLTTEEELRPRYLLAHFEFRVENLIKPEKHSTWRKLLRVQALVLRFVNNLKLGKKNRQSGSITREEYVRAENRLYQQVQSDVFMDEITIIRHNASSSIDKRKDFDKSSLLRTCSPYLDENGVLRIKGRIDAAKYLTFQAKRPIILPRDHQITKLIVQSFHSQYHHMNHQTTLNEVNQKFFIPGLRRTLKSVIQNSCQRCKNDRANPRVPEMADLPPARLSTHIRPFTYAGIDYFGPMKIKVNRSTVKRWGVLITCLSTRAIHIEVAHSLNTSSCILTIRNFMNRRGTPAEFFSDNGSNFHGSDNELREEFKKVNLSKIQEEFTSATTQWSFNPPLAPHMGGSWERMIRTVKSILYKSMSTRIPTEEMLQSYLIETENIVNSRPLTYVSLEHAEDEVLTPNHFLLGSSNGVRCPGEFNEKHLLRNDWKAVQQMTNIFWHRFTVEYLPTLTRRTKWFKDVKQVEVGDVVVIVDEKNERNTWPKGIVQDVIKGKDGKVRQAYVKTVVRPNNSKSEPAKIKTYLRPVAKLAVLDVGKLSNSMGAVNGGENVGNRNNFTTVFNQVTQ